MNHEFKKPEITVYAVLWAAVLITPLTASYIDSLRSMHVFTWEPVLKAWGGFVPFLVLFCVHDLLVAPLLLNREKRRRWIVGSVILLILFAAFEMTVNPGVRPPDEGSLPPQHGPHAVEPPPPPKPMNPAGIVNVALGVMMCGLNLGVKLYFKSQRDEALLMERKKEDLKKELEFLTYQINPHFFMNTLNNIHALIDIDPEKAKSSVIELSKMMRYVLYEGNAEAVPLKRELDFLTHYIALMRLRYIDAVDISTDFTDAADEATVPPLLLVTFVENAFKHGVSYRSSSFIHIGVSIKDGLMHFSCVNSVPEKQREGKPGIGLVNVRKRLELIYGENFKLDINKEADTFSVSLVIPTSHDKMYSNG